MTVMRTNSGVRVTAAVGVFWLPLGRPGRRLAIDEVCCLLAALALLAAFSASLRTICSTRMGTHAVAGCSPRITRRKPTLVLACHTGWKEAIETMGVFARFGGYDFIADQQVDVLSTVQMLTRDPKQHGPRQCLGEQALHRPITATWVCPARDAQHRQRPVMTNSAATIRLNWRSVVAVRWVGGIGKVLQCP